MDEPNITDAELDEDRERTRQWFAEVHRQRREMQELHTALFRQILAANPPKPRKARKKK